MELHTATRWRISLLAGLALLSGPGSAPSAGADAPAPFEQATVRFEQNATDRDVEVVFEVSGGDEGLSKLAVVGPDGRTVIDFTAPDASTLGIRKFKLESPEPGDVDSLKAAYPQGVYRFSGTTAGGEDLRGEATLNHGLPATASFLRPGPVAKSDEAVELAWSPVEDLSGYIVEIEQEELAMKIVVTLPGSATRFAVPDGFLRPGMEYKIGLGTVTDEGNISFIETSFETAPGS